MSFFPSTRILIHGQDLENSALQCSTEFVTTNYVFLDIEQSFTALYQRTMADIADMMRSQPPLCNRIV